MREGFLMAASNDDKQQQLKFRIGSKIIKFGQVYRVFQVDKDKDIIHFAPYYKTKRTRSITCSIPVASLEKARIRKPLSQKEVKKLLKLLGSNKDLKNTGSIIQAREKLSLNDPIETANLLRSLWRDRKSPSINYTKSRQDLFKSAMRCLVEEIAFVQKLPVKEARKKIRKTLNKIKVTV